MPLKILHIAAQNWAGVPYEIVREEKRRGIDSRLITMWRHPYGFVEDECLELPFVAGGIATLFQRFFATTPKVVPMRRRDLSILPPEWRGNRFPANLLFSMRDALWEKILRKRGFPQRMFDCDILVLDGGVPLLRNCNWEEKFFENSGKIATFYYGSDLRQRGVFTKIDRISEAVFVLEFDHIALHPRAVWLPFPFDSSKIKRAKPPSTKPIRIGHSANNRSAKHSELILSAIGNLEKKYDVECVMIEKLPHEKALEMKSTCHIFVDQLGELGYGISGLEALAMGIPTVVELLPDHERFIGEHPFFVANKNDLESVLEGLILNENLRKESGEKSIEWVKKFHDPARAVDIIHRHYEQIGFISR